MKNTPKLLLILAMMLNTTAYQSQCQSLSKDLNSLERVDALYAIYQQNKACHESQLENLEAIDNLTSIVQSLDKNNLQYVADNRALKLEVVALREEKEKQSVRQATLEQAAKYDKPFGISPAVIYDATGKVRFGIGLTWTPNFLRFRL